MADIEATLGYIRKRFRDLEVTSSDSPNKAYAEYTSAAPVIPLGHQEYTVGGTVVPLASIPADAKRMHLRALTGGIFWTDDGSTPSSSHGFPILENEWLLYDSEPTTSFKMISNTSADVRVAYYG